MDDVKKMLAKDWGVCLFLNSFGGFTAVAAEDCDIVEFCLPCDASLLADGKTPEDALCKIAKRINKREGR